MYPQNYIFLAAKTVGESGQFLNITNYLIIWTSVKIILYNLMRDPPTHLNIPFTPPLPKSTQYILLNLCNFFHNYF